MTVHFLGKSDSKDEQFLRHSNKAGELGKENTKAGMRWQMTFKAIQILETTSFKAIGPNSVSKERKTQGKLQKK